MELNSFQNVPYANNRVGCGDTVTFNNAFSSKSKRDEQLLTMLCCKYAYYFRSKMFYGEVLSHSFTFTEKTIENKNIDVLNTLLLSLTTDLILSFDRL